MAVCLKMDRTITALKAQKRNPNRVSVYLDGEYAFGLARIVAAWLSVGQELSESKIQSLQLQDAQEVAFQRALRFLSYRPRAVNEVEKKLSEHGFDEQEIETVVTRLKEGGLLDDEQFARMWVENRSSFRPRGRRVLTMELRHKGVPEDSIQLALQETQSETNLAYQAALKQARRLNGLDWQGFREKLSAFLARRGFSYGTIAPVVRRVWAERENAESQPDIDNEE
jgi:regulatory protein